jgi:hypothetical protein
MTTSTNTAAETYNVLSHRFNEVEKKVERFARKAAKLGLPDVSVEVVGEELVEETDGLGRKTGRVLVFKVIQVHGEAPVVAGHTFVARVEHTPAGNIISKAPGVVDVAVPAEIRDGAPTCDHCKTNRRRNDTFVLREDATGAFIRVGRNCLADFLRTADAAEALRLWSFLSDLAVMSRDMDEPTSGFGSGHFDLSLTHFVACALKSVDLDGWVSRKAAYNDESVTSTATSAAFAANPRPNDRYSGPEWDKAQPSEDHFAEAKLAAEWAKNLDGSSDYEHNLKVVCSLSYVGTKNLGVAASVVMAFRRFRERELAQELEAKRAASKPSGHFGAVGSRYFRQLTIARVNSWNNDYGTTVLYTMEDAEGTAFKWFSSGGSDHPTKDRSLDVGDELFFTFGIKGHGEYKGRKETTVTRATASVDTPTHKWANPDTGEVYKTKKAMKADLETKAA